MLTAQVIQEDPIIQSFVDHGARVLITMGVICSIIYYDSHLPNLSGQLLVSRSYLWACGPNLPSPRLATSL